MQAQTEYPLLSAFPSTPGDTQYRCVTAFGSPATLRFCDYTHRNGTHVERFDVPLSGAWKQPLALACSANQRSVAVATHSGTTAICQYRHHDPVVTFSPPSPALRGSVVAWSPTNEASVLVGYGVWPGQTFMGHTVEHYDPTVQTSRSLEVSSASVTSIAFVPSHPSKFAMSTPHEFIQLCDLQTPHAVQSSFGGKDRGAIYCLAFHPTFDNYLVACTPTREVGRLVASFVYLWDMRQPSKPVSQSVVHTQKNITSLMWGREPRALIATTQEDNFVTVMSLDRMNAGTDTPLGGVTPNNASKLDSRIDPYDEGGYTTVITDTESTRSSTRRNAFRGCVNVPKADATAMNNFGNRLVTPPNVANPIHAIAWGGSDFLVLASQRGDVTVTTLSEHAPLCSWKSGHMTSIVTMENNVLHEQVVDPRPSIGQLMRERIEQGFSTRPSENAVLLAKHFEQFDEALVCHWLATMDTHNSTSSYANSQFAGLIGVLGDNSFGSTELHRRHFVLQMVKWEEASDRDGVKTMTKNNSSSRLSLAANSVNAVNGGSFAAVANSSLSSTATNLTNGGTIPSPVVSNSTNNNNNSSSLTVPLSAIPSSSSGAWPHEFLDEKSQLERRVFILVAQGRVAEAAELLKSKSENEYVLLSALITSGAKLTALPATDNLSMYLSAVLSYLLLQGPGQGMTSRSLEEHFHMLPLFDQIGIAVTCIPDIAALTAHLRCLQVAATRRSPLNGIIFTGLNDDGAELIQQYVNITADVQLATSIGVFASKQFGDRWNLWHTAYQEICNHSQRYMHRCLFDRQLLTIQQSMNLEGKRDSRRRPTTVVRCSHCAQQLHYHAAPVQQYHGLSKPPTGGPGSGSGTGARLRSQCPNPQCRKPLPRCAVCRQTMDATAVSSPPMEHGSWFLWCSRCQHGGHAAHILRWFSTNSTCPVEPCECNCCATDMLNFNNKANTNITTTNNNMNVKSTNSSNNCLPR
eukprot:PhM_4_TR10058/c0_g1_i1/m.42573/K20407/MIOS, MIO; WD repeat-containing protein mio